MNQVLTVHLLIFADSGDPLIVVDGMVMENRDFARLNPATIASISVIKDASAAVYVVLKLQMV